MFQLFFGKSAFDDECDVDEMVLKIDTLQRGCFDVLCFAFSFLPFDPNFGRPCLLGFNRLLSVVYSGDYAPSIYCDDEALHLEEKEENGEGKLRPLFALLVHHGRVDRVYCYYFFSTNIPRVLAIFINTEDDEEREFSMMIGDHDALCDDPTIFAALQTPDDDRISNDDWIFFCPRAFEAWSNDNLVGLHNKPVSLVEGQALDGILSKSPEANLFHELTHSADIFSIRRNGRDMQSGRSHSWTFGLASSSLHMIE